MFRHAHLPNELTLIAELQPEARSVAIGVFVSVGARDDPNGLSGISHFLEHLCFKGNAHRDALALNAAFDAIGVRADAFTTQDMTAYHGVALPEHQAPLTALLLGLLRPALREADVDMERQVILEEIAMYRDDPGSVLFESATHAFFGSHPFARSVLGTRHNLEAIKGDDLRSHVARWYAPDRVTVVACGCVDWAMLEAQVAALTADWQPSRAARTYPSLEPQLCRTRAHGEVNRAQAALYLPGFAAQDAHHLAADVLAQIVGGANSRLYWALNDDGLCDDASLEHSADDGLGAYYGTLSTDPQDLGEALERYQAVLGGVQQDGITRAELERTKKRLEVALTLRFETPGSRLLSLGEEFITLGRYRSVPELAKALRDLSLDDIHAVLEAAPLTNPCITTLEPVRDDVTLELQPASS